MSRVARHRSIKEKLWTAKEETQIQHWRFLFMFVSAKCGLRVPDESDSPRSP